MLAAAGAGDGLARIAGESWARVNAGTLASAGDRDRLADHVETQPLLPLHPDDPLDAALRRLATQPVIPVVSRMDPGRLLGRLSLDDVHRAYGLRSPAE